MLCDEVGGGLSSSRRSGRGGQRCCVATCRKRRNIDDETKTYFSFPKEEARAEMWLENIGYCFDR